MENNTNKGFDTDSNTSDSTQNNKTYADNKAQKSSIPIQEKLPNSGAILTLGILSIATLCCCGPFLGMILAIIALSLAPGVNRELTNKPDYYKISTINNFKAGKICAIVGLCLGAIYLIYFILYFIVDFSLGLNVIDEVNRFWNEMNY